MSTNPNPKILDPDFAKAGAKEIIEACSPLLREVVNHATHAFLRCQFATNSLGGLDEDVAPFALYRIVTEATDAIQILIAESCGFATLPLLRTSFEALLGLEYINREDSGRRGLAWFYVNHLELLRLSRLLSKRSNEGKAYAEAWLRQHGVHHVEPTNIDETIGGLLSLLSKAHLKEIETEYTRTRSKLKGRRPAWHSLFDGPENTRKLAVCLNRETDYDFLYRYWSLVAHGIDTSNFVATLAGGKTGYKSMRYPGDIPEITKLASIFQFSATLSMVGRYRPGENLEPWYSSEVKVKLEELAKTQFVPDIIER